MSDDAQGALMPPGWPDLLRHYARFALATTKMLERVFGRDAVNAALKQEGYDGLISLVKQIHPEGGWK